MRLLLFPQLLNYFRSKKNDNKIIENDKNLHLPIDNKIIINDVNKLPIDNENDKNYMKDGIDIAWKDTTEFTFPIKGGRVIKVYDGDTITIASKLPYENSPLYRFSVRLNGIDTPEIKGKGVGEEEKLAAIEAREAVSKLILNKYVKLENIKNEKYGRILADVYIDNFNINEYLLRERYAMKYNGDTKIKPKSWIKYKNTGDIN
jgi:endonuclease YncB( thermonuclease family)